MNSINILHNKVDERWSYKKPKIGDHIRVERSFYYHHGIYISDKEVIHFASRHCDSILNPKNCKIILTDLRTFLANGKVQVKIYSEKDEKILKKQDEIVETAKSMLGKKGYDLVYNNCEHFANYCTMNKKISNQIENIRKGKLPKYKFPLDFLPINNIFLYILFNIALECVSTRRYNQMKSYNHIKKSKQTKDKKNIVKSNYNYTYIPDDMFT